MDFKQLFETQRKLDERIVEEKGLQGQNLLDEKILALQVEIGELANEWRGFKFWSKDQKPNTEETIKTYYALREGRTKNPLLEEYVDCLHFILSIGLDIGFQDSEFVFGNNLAEETTTKTFNAVFSYVSTLNAYIDVNLPVTITIEDIQGAYQDVFECFASLGALLGFTDEQIEQAYYDKNKINHERQSDGY